MLVMYDVLISCYVYVAILSREECHVWFILCMVNYCVGVFCVCSQWGDLMYACLYKL